ncbi:hypothetical protein QUF18_14915 [Pseudochrobactrum kiredjianiae]|uniref:Uncharacterized protein n=1 Tax=Pseudochrobactrum kiredjianiae TaxID=386305 RepID=A0ABW3V6E9_9HYPH|nr:hypothetical protein [Pseudochrobactrum kiredjianiae]MDM7852311.1 hypothetical protein [Pseudochrobactrum kiredjianiae]
MPVIVIKPEDVVLIGAARFVDRVYVAVSIVMLPLAAGSGVEPERAKLPVNVIVDLASPLALAWSIAITNSASLEAVKLAA